MELQIDRREVTPALIEEIACRIAEHFDPRRIVLFGSWARGDAGPDSDIDLFVEMESDQIIPERAVSISKLFGLHWWPMDLVVYTPEEVEQVSGVIGTLYNIIENEGVVLYDREAGDKLPCLDREG